VTKKDPGDLSGFSMLELFQLEMESQGAVLTENLLALEQSPANASRLEKLMRAAHSVKGAARMIDREVVASVAHELEEVFVAAQRGEAVLLPGHVDVLLRGVDLLQRVAQTPEEEIGKWSSERAGEVRQFLTDIAKVRTGKIPEVTNTALGTRQEEALNFSETLPVNLSASPVTGSSKEAEEPKPSQQRFLRVTAENLNRILALTGESLVESSRFGPFSGSLLRLKRQHNELAQTLDKLRESFDRENVSESTEAQIIQAQAQLLQCRQLLAERLLELENFGRRSVHLSHRLYNEALASRMRPFADGVHGFPRMVRDLARDLGKKVRLEIQGQNADVDRDILERLEAPLTHLLRNAIDHGIELPEERCATGKPQEGLIRLDARHSGGNLLITVSDDGRGIDLAELRIAIADRGITSAQTIEKMSEAELLDFLLLPGFTMKESVTQISGRGVGLDAVHAMVKEVRGAINITTQPGHGTTFQLHLPLALSIVRALLVEIGNEPYAFPLVHVKRVLKIGKEKIEAVEGRQHFHFEDQQIGLVAAHQILGSEEEGPPAEELSVVLIGNKDNAYGLVVGKFLGEHELVVQPLDRRLGKIKDVSAGALMEDGSPVLIIDVEDLIRSTEKLVDGGTLSGIHRVDARDTQKKRKRILVVDDSLTVRELERKFLETCGYEIEIAVDGMDGWNAVRTGHFDLVVSDVDMPRMDGIELVSFIRKDGHLKSLPVLIVSYKDREEDRRRGLEAGADYYLAKGSFHDEALLEAVTNLIGEAEE
jgi:two-component system, chemotaxis family, sensor histidine kinase and response regulator WspE